ncbi:TIGR04282 family arsenosugar biosynthesis glycosyltransferase [Gammaproteobacteria bacterium]|nr:TIGR04282 family arsenosugar biosynthesis glycosyltransferase [Gammaproteobacteria bacterium]
MKFPQACVLMFAKEPVAGKVKTRLITSLGADGAKDLHIQLLQRQIDVLEHSSLCHKQLWVNANPQHSVFKKFSGERKRQSGADLGEKMCNAAKSALQDFKQVVIIGSDCPDIDEAYLQQALEALVSGNDVVLGPAQDGGYVLVGLSRLIPEIFEDVSWGSEKVLRQTQSRLQANNIVWQELPERFDIDRPEDLEKLSAFDLIPEYK